MQAYSKFACMQELKLSNGEVRRTRLVMEAASVLSLLLGKKRKKDRMDEPSVGQKD